MNKKSLIPTLGLAVLLAAGVLGVTAARADDFGSYPPFVQNLAERFGLNEDEVKSFFDEERQERQQVMQQNREERLNQAVSDGVISEEQKQALLNKWGEKKAEREQHKEEMAAWFGEQGIDPEQLRSYGGFGHHGFGKWGGIK